MVKRVCILMMVLSLLMVSTSVVFADDSQPGNVVLTGGVLSVLARTFSFNQGPEASANSNVITLDGHLQTVHFTEFAADWEVVDPTGTGSGYHVEISATDFAGGMSTTGSIPKVITADRFSARIPDVDITLEDPESNTKPVSEATSYAPLDSDLPFMTAAVNTGMGSYRFDPDFELEIPADTYAGTYVSTVTITITTGP